MKSSQERNRPILFLVLLSLAFLFRLAFGVSSDFWNLDEKQIYLIGLKQYTDRLVLLETFAGNAEVVHLDLAIDSLPHPG